MSFTKRKPKFNFQLSIHELTNVPLPSNDCYIKWYLREPLTTLKSSAVKGKTEKQHVRDYKCHWKYTVENIIKISTNSNKELIPRMLVLMVYSTPHRHHPHSPLTHKRSSNLSNNDLSAHEYAHEGLNKKEFLGKVEINISDFVGQSDEAINNRYLLQDSKINAILNLSIGVELIKGTNTAEFNSPPCSAIKKRALNDVFSNSGNNSTTGDVDSSQTSNKVSSTKHNDSQLSPITRDHSNSKLLKNLAIMKDPIVSKFYERTFEISWDVRPGEYTAKECVEDIIASPDGDGWAKNEDGVRLIDLQNEDTAKETERYVTGSFNDIRPHYIKSTSINGIEMFKQNEMKSWTIDQKHLSK